MDDAEVFIIPQLPPITCTFPPLNKLPYPQFVETFDTSMFPA
jgi:hypothetical protein